jgi:hypothetical protein
MHIFSSSLTRRDFMKGSAGLTLAAAMGMHDWTFARSDAPKTKVVLVRDENVVDKDGNIDAAIIQEMLDKGVAELFRAQSATEAWKGICSKDDIVGIKTNVWPNLPTPRELEEAIKRRLLRAGVKEDNISIDDRGVRRNPVFQRSTAIINARPMRTHDWSGVGGCIKNFIPFTERPWEYHPGACASLAKLWDLPAVKGKTRLNILVLLTPLFYGIGPHHYDATYTWKYNGLLIGVDPVALDAVGLHLFIQKRRQFFSEDRPFKPLPRHIGLADTEYHLGTSDLNKIELVKLGWMKDILI